MKRFDVVVFGAGVSGVCAAIGAARLGRNVLLVEKNALTGGAITNADVRAPAMFNAWGRQIIGGIGWELVTKALIEEGRPVPDCTKMDAADHVGSAIWLNTLLFAAICDEELMRSGAKLSLHTMPVAMEARKNGWVVSAITKEGPWQFAASQVVDCTGDGDVIALCGVPFLPYEECQPGTYSFLLEGYDPDAIDYDLLGKRLQEAVNAGELETGDVWWCGNTLPKENNKRAGMWKQFLGRKGENANHITMPDPSIPGTRTNFELAGRAAALRVWRFLKKQEGFQKLTISMRSSECGCRESRRIDAIRNVTVEEYRNGVQFEDAICYSFYPIDLHDESCGLRVEPIRKGVFPTVPMGAIIPKSSRNLLAAGRLVGSDRLANSALRIQATCMATGQAAGVLAALATDNCTPQEVLYCNLRENLLVQGAILP